MAGCRGAGRVTGRSRGDLLRTERGRFREVSPDAEIRAATQTDRGIWIDVLDVSNALVAADVTG